MNRVDLVKDFSGRILARIETDSRGNKTVRNFNNWILGRYDAQSNTTRDFYGRIVARGDACSLLISMQPPQP